MTIRKDRHFLMSQVLRRFNRINSQFSILNFQFINILINFPKALL